MTNLIAITMTIVATNTVSLKTNVTESLVDPKFITMFGQTINWNPASANEKWVTTTVIKEDKLTFPWLGKDREVVETSMVSSNTVHLRVKQDWEQVK